MNRSETAVVIVLVMAIVVWALVGPDGWIAGLVGAAVGLAAGVTMVMLRRRRSLS